MPGSASLATGWPAFRPRRQSHALSIFEQAAHRLSQSRMPELRALSGLATMADAMAHCLFCARMSSVSKSFCCTDSARSVHASSVRPSDSENIVRSLSELCARTWAPESWGTAARRERTGGSDYARRSERATEAELAGGRGIQARPEGRQGLNGILLAWARRVRRGARLEEWLEVYLGDRDAPILDLDPRRPPSGVCNDHRVFCSTCCQGLCAAQALALPARPGEAAWYSVVRAVFWLLFCLLFCLLVCLLFCLRRSVRSSTMSAQSTASAAPSRDGLVDRMHIDGRTHCTVRSRSRPDALPGF